MWERLERGQKLIAAIVGISTIGGTISGGLVFMSRNAAASQTSAIVATEIVPLKDRTLKLEAHYDDIRESQDRQEKRQIEMQNTLNHVLMHVSAHR